MRMPVDCKDKKRFPDHFREAMQNGQVKKLIEDLFFDREMKKVLKNVKESDQKLQKETETIH